MKLSPFVDRIGGEGAAGWDIHFEAKQAQRRGEDVIVCLFAAGDAVVVPDPAYLTYEATIRASGAELIRVAPTDGFRPDVDAMSRAGTPATKGIVITTPANPTGVVMTPAELPVLRPDAGASPTSPVPEGWGRGLSASESGWLGWQS